MFTQDFGLKSLKERVWLQDLGVEGRMRLNGMVKQQGEKCCLGSCGSGQGPVAGSCKMFQEYCVKNCLTSRETSNFSKNIQFHERIIYMLSILKYETLHIKENTSAVEKWTTGRNNLQQNTFYLECH